MKAVFGNDGSNLEGSKNLALGTSSGGRQDNTLGADNTLIIRLVCFALGTLDRQSRISIENNMVIQSGQRISAQRILARHGDHAETLAAIMRHFKSGNGYAAAHANFSKICQVASTVDAFDSGVRRRLATIGGKMGIEREEIDKLFVKFSLGK